MKKPALIAWLVSAFAGSLLADAPQIVLDGVRQRYPWNNDVDIDYTVSGVEEPANVFVRFRLKENAEAEPVTLTEFGDISTLAEASNGTYRVVWRADRERSGHFFSTNAVMTAELVYSPNMEGMPYNVFKDYIVVDLSGGVSAETFPVSHVTMTVDAATNTFNTAEYKTNKLVLRRVGACTFPMGEETQPYYDTTLAPETPHEVTLTKDFFIGIYEVTQKQYELVTGVAASYGDRPVVNVSCYNMRGDAGGVLEKPSSGSFFGILSAKTGLDFDSPYEAQWECACKAGTETVWYTGYDSVDGEYAEPLSTIAWHKGNSSGAAHAVGGKLPNAWGIYDMVGNVWEWCRDGAPWNLGSEAVVDPVGDPALTSRVGRGGSFKYGVGYDHQTIRTIESYESRHDEVGFRASLTVE